MIGLLILLVAAPTVTFWAVERSESHNRWTTEFVLAQTFREQLNTAYVQLVNDSLQGSVTLQAWATNTLSSAGSVAYDIAIVDKGHVNQLDRIQTTLEELSTLRYALNLTAAQRLTMANILLSIGDKIVSAYYLNGTNIYGVDFWYNGPSPPSDSILYQAVDLTKLPGLPCFDYQSCNNVSLRW
jgi:hypothetical protein